MVINKILKIIIRIKICGICGSKNNVVEFCVSFNYFNNKYNLRKLINL